MRNRFLIHTVFITALSLCTALFSTAFAAVGPQSIKVTFNGNTAEGWQASSDGSITSVADGVANVQMALQSNNMYRADFQNQVAGTFAIDKTRDIVWAIKLTAPLPGTANSRKFEFQYKDADNADKWVNGINGPSGQIDCEDDGRIYYFNLAADGLNKLGALQDGAVSVNKVHFIFADATELTDETARYAVDWVATFTSVADLQEFANWKDEETDLSLPYLEMQFRINGGSSYDNNYSKNGFKDDSFEGNYKANIFAVEYFLIEDYSFEKVYTLNLTTVGGGGTDVMAVWDFPYEVSHGTAASEMNTKAATVVGYAPGAPGEGDEMNTPIATSSCTNSVWSFAIPAHKLTPLATIDGKTLVGLLVTSNQHDADKKGKFASSCHATIAHPSFTHTGSNPVVNLTQSTAYATLKDAVDAAIAEDILELRGDIASYTDRLTITKTLTIQGATGAEKITCSVPNSSIMLLVKGAANKATLTIKNLIIDGNNATRSTRFIEAGDNKAAVVLEDITVTSTNYTTDYIGDVRNSGGDITLKGNNILPAGIALNSGNRIDGEHATHSSPIKLILGSGYAENYAIVSCTDDPSQYDAVGDDGLSWHLYVNNSGTCHKEIMGEKFKVFSLDDSSDNATILSSNNDKYANVTLNRTIARNGDYATFCAPFAISREALEEHLGTTEVLRYKRTVIEGDEAVLIFDDDVTDLEAGVPYLIKPAGGDNVTSMTFNNVVIDNTLRESADDHYRFIPLFSQETVSNTGAENKSVVYLGASNQLYWAGPTCTINGFRAYFRVADGAAATMAPVRRMSFGRGAGVTTALDNSAADAAQSKRLENGRLVIVRDGVRYNALGQVIQ